MDEKERIDDNNFRVRGKLTGALIWERSSVEAALAADAEEYGANEVSDCVLFDLLNTLPQLSAGISTLPQLSDAPHVELDLVTGWQHAEIQNQRRRAFTSSETTDCLLCDVRVEELVLQVADASPNDDAPLAGNVAIVEGLLPPQFHDRRYHILLREGQIEKCLVQTLVMSGNVSTLGLPWCDAAAHLPSLLAALPSPSNSPLRHLLLYQEGYSILPSEWQETMGALCKSANSGLLDGVAVLLDWTRRDAQEVIRFCEFGEFCKSLTYLGIYNAPDGFFSAESDPDHVEYQLKQFFGNFEVISESWKVRGCNKWLTTITRLDFRNEFDVSLFPQLVTILMEECRSLRDLGLPIRRMQGMKNLVDSGLLAKIVTLRLSLELEEKEAEAVWKMLVLEGLKDSTILFLDCNFYWSRQNNDRLLPLGGTSTSLKGLRLRLSNPHGFLRSLPKYLRSSSLLYIDIVAAVSIYDEEWDEWECANALINNFCLCALSLPWTIPAAAAHAASLLRRNLLYREGKLLKEPQVKPNTAKLFLCGHAEAGKTTLCRALQQQMTSRGSSRNWLCTSMLGRTISGGGNSEIDRTRGMELHPLAFRGNQKKLLICDLGGQQQFHVLHHYFMNASNNDLFLVVCKFVNNLEVFEHRLNYWFRFIISHRSAQNGNFTSVNDGGNLSRKVVKPKAIVVVNFFDEGMDCTKMTSIASECAVNVMNKFSEVLDFAGVHGRCSKTHENLFGLNARTSRGVHPLELQLESSVQHFAHSASPIPQLCYDISAKLAYQESPSRTGCWLCPNFFGKEPRKSRLLISCAEIWDMIFHDHEDTSSHASYTRVQAALQELHNQGYLVFFPSANLMEYGNSTTALINKFRSTLVITDISWFCNKLVGSLLGTHLEGEPRRDCQWVWLKGEIRIMLLEQGCETKHLDEILRYLENLELCISLVDSDSGHEQGRLLFPALMKVEDIIYPTIVCNATSPTHFFGRRIRCMDSTMHLIPFGLFTRLQVKLHKEYGVGNKSFELGYGWVSFSKGNVGVVVRFGSGGVNEAWESRQWVDILIFPPGSCGFSNEGSSSNMPAGGDGFVAGNQVMMEIKNLIYATCKTDGFGGIPMVKLEEWVLQGKEPDAQAVLLSKIWEKVRKEGLEKSYQEWAEGTTRLIDLLLPEEREAHVKGQLRSMVVIKDEFTLTSWQMSLGDGEDLADAAAAEAAASRESHGGKLKALSRCATVAGKQQLTGQFLELFERLGAWRVHDRGQVEEMHETLQQLDRNVLHLDRNVQLLRDDIHKFEKVLRDAERSIIENCSTLLLRHELRQDRAYPLYPYLADAQGKLAPLWDLLGKRVVVHFMCESPTQGPHPVKGHKGKKVMLEVKEWVPKVARVVVPAVRIICFLARVAASVYLPSAHVFMPSPEGLVSGLGLEKDALQHVILPKALEVFLGQLPNVNFRNFLTERGSKIDKNEVKEVMKALLQNLKVDMASDFGLHRVVFNNHVHDGKTFWVCKDHIDNGNRLVPIPNPFQL